MTCGLPAALLRGKLPIALSSVRLDIKIERGGGRGRVIASEVQTSARFQVSKFGYRCLRASCVQVLYRPICLLYDG